MNDLESVLVKTEWTIGIAAPDCNEYGVGSGDEGKDKTGAEIL